ncbi:TPA: hypothetical protein N0F65_002138 [Lagenidium giganteum]|uniref:DUF7869 domain-containing protein n=1 Tax=Lagenidium giganteum TaxID=4803 RepID=A0AAV2ZAC3_9STRA|nr:TPA: hypothetical protein N0F65_002138 [Lagenidium giganteum]
MKIKKRCPLIQLASPRSNVCVECSIYKQSLTSQPDASAMEIIGQHTQAAQQMRLKYKEDTDAATEDNLVLTIDYSQNFSLPSTFETPSELYFLSLHWVYLFGVHSASDNVNTNFLYSERKGRKGQQRCRILLMLAHTGMFKRVRLHFLVKGHTKNACDRGFALIRKLVARRNCWTLQHLRDAVETYKNDQNQDFFAFGVYEAKTCI